jgi:hypothetical protein
MTAVWTRRTGTWTLEKLNLNYCLNQVFRIINNQVRKGPDRSVIRARGISDGESTISSLIVLPCQLILKPASLHDTPFTSLMACP